MENSEQIIHRIDKHDMRLRLFGLIVLFALVITNIFSIYRIQSIIYSNQANAVYARKQNVERQNEIKGYIKCIVLLRYNNPGLSETSSKQDVSNALDKCAVTTVKE